MRYLLINTAVSVSSVVLIYNDEVISKIEEKNAGDLSSKIFFMIDEVFKEGNCGPKDLKKIFVVNGPGSFTGIRIGLSIAKTMAWALGIDLIPISSLELFATTNVQADNFISMIDARRNYVYAGIYNSKLDIVLEQQHILLADLLDKVSKVEKNVFISYDEFEDLEVQIPEIDYLKIVKKHENDVIDSCHNVNPVYLKLTEAEENRKLNEN